MEMTRIRSARTAGAAVRPDVPIASMDRVGTNPVPGVLHRDRFRHQPHRRRRGTVAFEALYAMWIPSLPMMPAIEDRLTIDPPPLAIIAGTACLMQGTRRSHL